ncbi:MAG: hypothetical protein WC508_03480 [Patescibacteria group bacterium]
MVFDGQKRVAGSAGVLADYGPAVQFGVGLWLAWKSSALSVLLASGFFGRSLSSGSLVDRNNDITSFFVGHGYYSINFFGDMPWLAGRLRGGEFLMVLFFVFYDWVIVPDSGSPI